MVSLRLPTQFLRLLVAAISVVIVAAQIVRAQDVAGPAHIAVVPVSRLLVNLDELMTILPDPAAMTSSMVLITGPSRTADIEQILVRGVHGPGQIHVVLVNDVVTKD